MTDKNRKVSCSYKAIGCNDCPINSICPSADIQTMDKDLKKLLEKLYVLFHYGINDKAVISQEADQRIVEILDDVLRGEE